MRKSLAGASTAASSSESASASSRSVEPPAAAAHEGSPFCAPGAYAYALGPPFGAQAHYGAPLPLPVPPSFGAL